MLFVPVVSKPGISNFFQVLPLVYHVWWLYFVQKVICHQVIAWQKNPLKLKLPWGWGILCKGLPSSFMTEGYLQWFFLKEEAIFLLPLQQFILTSFNGNNKKSTLIRTNNILFKNRNIQQNNTGFWNYGSILSHT